jgi:PAS domain S-box-containing protein
MLGYASSEELLKRSAFDIAPVSEHERIRADIAATLQRGTVRNVEYTFLKKDGAPFRVELSGTVSFDSNGKPAGLVVIGHDITERRQAERRILQLLDLLDHASDSIIIRDLEGHIQYFNEGAERLLGWTADEACGRRITDLFFEDASGFDVAEEKLKQTGKWDGELHAVTKAGKTIILHSRWTLVDGRDGEPSHVVSISTDITERKHAERALLASEERFRQLADNIREVFWISDPAKNEIVYVSPGYEEIWGRTRESLYRSARDWIEAIHPDDRKRVLEAALTKQVSCEYDEEYRIVRADGLIRWIQDRAFPVQDGSGKVYRIVGIAEDITERKKAEDAVRKAEARYRGIFENATEGIFRTTLEGRLLIANPALVRLFGYQSPKEMMSTVTNIGQQLYVSPEKRAEMLRLVIERGSVQGFEAENYHRNGNIIWVSLNAHVVRDSGGTAKYLEGTLQDITERKWAERLLQTQRDFGTFLSSSIDLSATAMHLVELALQNEGIDCCGVFLVDPETKAMDLAAHKGFSADFAKRTSYLDSIPTPAHAAAASRTIQQPVGPLAGIVQQLQREGLRSMEILPIQHSAEVVAVLAVGSHVREIPIKSYQALEVIAAQTAGAITRIRVGRSLRANRRLLERTLHSLPSAVLVLNAGLMIIEECNPSTTRIFGYTREELAGRTINTLHVNRAMAKQFTSLLQAVVEDEGFLTNLEFKMKHKNGSVFSTEVSMMPIRNEGGRLVNWVCVVQDITERKRAEQELRQLHRRIIEAQETERLRVARELHDGVNQVIASVKMRLRKLESRRAAFNPADREILARCDKLLVQALEENRRIAYNLRPSDLDELGLAAACRNFCDEIQARTNLTVKCRIAPSKRRLPPTLELNLFRIVQEAITNAEKHAHAQLVRLNLSFPHNAVVLEIHDNGRGFIPQQPKSGKGRWAGIGLTNMRERALSLGGTFKISSLLGKGTTVIAQIPCKQGN